MSVPCPLHPTALRAWQPLTDAEFASLKPFLPAEDGRGRPSDKRKTLDAIFWIAASKEPWRALPDTYGKPDSIAKTLRRWARGGILDRLLLAVSKHPFSTFDETLRSLTWLICRAFRRMGRVLDEDSIQRADRLGMVEALPANPVKFHDPILSETVDRCHRAISRTLVADDDGLLNSAIRAFRAFWKLAQIAKGNRRQWKLK